MVAAIIGSIVVIISLIVFISFNRLAKARNASDAAWQQVIMQFGKRRDLIPGFIDCLRSVAETDAQRFKDILQMRRHDTIDGTVESVTAYENEVTHELKNLLRGIASFPELKSSQEFYDLGKRLTESEDHIEYARKHYNDTIRAYNAARLKFPMNRLASQLGFDPESFFEVEYVTTRKTPEDKPEVERR